ncbi:T9SS type A sorting domain-containing protein [Hymenobacter baengnokdamensis]|uniref:T9SS type A sorting domain-containing protein n=1 Tax=Hymenobacter baengnokdamensis TaxID=2615203 RepID=UPI001243CB4F|nr:T9SS type A sorting domain-containing protein [Hymenobacter baengnokdamensis]
MKKQLLHLLFLLALLAGASNSGWGQAAPSDGVGNPLKERQVTFGSLAPGRISTGVLLDRMLFLTNPHRFAGLGDTSVSYKGFEQQYWEFYHAALDSTRLTTLATLRASIAERVQQDVVPLLMLHYSYNELAVTAARDQLVTLDSTNERVYDGPDMSRSPYTTGQFFSVVLPVTATGSVLSVYVGPEFWLGNTPAPNSVTIDFGDGWGGRTIAMGTTIQVQVTTAGTEQATLKPATSKPAMEVDPPLMIPPPRIAGGGTLRVTNPTTGLTGATTLGATTPTTIPPNVALGVLASRAWPGFTPTRGVYGPNGHATAIAWIKYADDNKPLPDGTRRLRRPLVFVEGIDFEDARGGNDKSGAGTYFNYSVDHTGPIDLANFTSGSIAQRGGFRNGSAGWNEMVDYNSDYKSLEQFPTLRAQLQAPASQSFPNGAGGGDYDLIYLDFSDGATLIQQNAMVFAELLQWINQPANRTTDAEETLVIAASMGGQVARFGLAWMEQQGLCHNSKLYVSFDSPHRGANVPLGIQYMFDRLQAVLVRSYSAQTVVRDKLMREASMQMTLFHFADGAIPFRTQWQAWQTSSGSYPSLLRKVAIANGSGRAVPQDGMFPGMRMLHTSGAGLFTGPNYAFALPGSTERGHTNVVFRYRTAISLFNRWHYSYADPNWSNYDTSPGSSETTAKDANDESSTLVADWKTNTFMSTISALDIQDAGGFNRPDFTYNVQQQIPKNNLPNRAKYAFDAYFTADNVNEPHVQITNGQASPNGNTSYTTDNGDWIQNELRESSHHMPPILTGAYNYGSPYRHLLPSVQVNAGGQLYLNNGTLPASGGTAATQSAPTQGKFDVYTCNCATVVQVNTGGQVLVGTSSTYSATLLMAANSLLDLQAGSRLDIGPGSMLRIAAGATLVLRAGTTLNLNGLLVVDAGGYVCIENPANLVTGPTGQLNLSQQANFFANPALHLTGLACQQCLTQGYLTINDGSTPAATCAPTSAVFSISASQGTQGPYTWQVSQGSIDSGQGTSQITVSGLPFQAYTLQVQVSAPATCAGAADLTQQLSQSYYTRSPDGSLCLNDGASFAALYPNPATDAVEVHLTAATTTSATASPLTARLFDAYGQPRAEQTSHGEAVLRLSTRQLPAGLYFVHLVRKGTVIGRQQLRIER